MQRTPIFIFFFFFGQMSLLPAQSDTLRVRAAATGANDGSSWENAFTDLQDALAQCAAGDEIWVAEGTYRPDTVGGSVASTFLLEKNIQLLGGFAGEGPDPDERDPLLHLTVLSGDLAGDDVTGNLDSNRTDNVRTVLTVVLGVKDSTLIDGFFIRSGHAVGNDSQFEQRRGGGLFSFGSPRIQHVFFENNFADASGGALYFHTAGTEGALVQDCFFAQNQASDGGAATVFNSNGAGVAFENCEFVENAAGDNGGALRVYNANCLLDGCTFQSNTAERGGAIDVRSIFDDNETVLKNSLITENSARQGGGVNVQTNSGLGASRNYLRIESCDFIANRAVQQDSSQQGGRQGGAIRINIDRTTDDCGVVIKHTSIVNSRSEGSAGAVFARLEGQGVEFVFQNGEISLTETGNGAAVQITAADVATGRVALENLFLAFNAAGEGPSGLSILAEGSSKVDFQVANCLFSGDLGVENGGTMLVACRDTAQLNLEVESCQFEFNNNPPIGAVAVQAVNGSLHADFLKCIFWSNASTNGAALTALPSADGAARLSLENCLFYENGQSPVIVADSFGLLRVVNCTFADNWSGSLDFSGNSHVFLQNNILASGTFPELALPGNDVTLTSGGGNLVLDNSADGLLGFLDQTSTDPDFSFPYQLAPNSPAIDAGVLPDDLWDTDLAGNPRLNGCPDAGAYESLLTVSADCLTAAREAMEVLDFLIFPNPASSSLQVVLPAANLDGTMLRLLDVHGRVLRSENMTGTETQVDVSDLPSGVYFLQIGGAVELVELVN